MKKLIFFLFISTMLFAQVRTEQVSVKKKIDENVVELRARLYGVFTDLKGKNKNQRTAYLNVNYKVGFLREN